MTGGVGDTTGSVTGGGTGDTIGSVAGGAGDTTGCGVGGRKHKSHQKKRSGGCTVMVPLWVYSTGTNVGVQYWYPNIGLVEYVGTV
jgi:hypothetical protein